MTNTAAAALALTDAREGAMALDLLDESPVDYLFEDENPYFTGALDGYGTPVWVTEYDMDEDFFWGLSVHNNG